MNKQDKPRICEVLGVDVGERFVINRKDSKTRYMISNTGNVFLDNGTGETISGADLALIINCPEVIRRISKFTEQEIEDAKAIKRLIYHAVGIYKGDGKVFIRRESSFYSVACADVFPSIAPGESYTLDEIIGEG